VNRCDLYLDGTQKLEAFFEARGAPLLGRIPYDLAITQAMAQGQPVTKHLPDSRASGALQNIWDALVTALDGSC
jgi:MinD superfamily P-loop ATPase